LQDSHLTQRPSGMTVFGPASPGSFRFQNHAMANPEGGYAPLPGPPPTPRLRRRSRRSNRDYFAKH
jgi:hypothetical protein